MDLLLLLVLAEMGLKVVVEITVVKTEVEVWPSVSWMVVVPTLVTAVET